MIFPRLFHTELSKDKAIHTLHRICNLGLTATPSLIYSVLYFADREYLALSGHTLYGETYLAYFHAPCPSYANHIYMTLRMPTRDRALYYEIRNRFLINANGQLINKDVTQRGEKFLGQYERNCI